MQDPDNPYANLDLSKTENIVTYVVGSEPNAIAEVMAPGERKNQGGDQHHDGDVLYPHL